MADITFSTGIDGDAAATTTRDGKTRKLALDARIPLAAVRDSDARGRLQGWVQAVCQDLGVKPKIARSLEGVVFEVRQGYKSKDSKRQNADIANAATAYTQGYLPCVALFSLQMDDDVYARYRSEKWAILTGRVVGGTALDSTP